MPDSLDNKKALRSVKAVWIVPAFMIGSKSGNDFSYNRQRLLNRVRLYIIFSLSICGNLNSFSIYL